MTYPSPRPFLSVLTLFLCLWSWQPLDAVAAPQAPPAKKAIPGGVGLQVVPIASGEIVVIAVLAKSPADKAKLRPGDLIIAVDGVALRGSKFADVTKSRLWGKAGTKVKLTWQRPGVAGKKSAQLVRTALKNEPAQDLEVQMLVPAAPPVSEATKP
jgi:C-terminal processing protease CtpA/Prc